ncbi:DUF493 domain-containing protein [Gilvimarinus sp. SDUM040013]|uniref:UPF0250 protein SCD92_07820 n=1 Tax=Gilvimarinus gilvus TaxID=3058038 RepID=A0ABU4S210_9GAMM|nr:DUF493 domain-containing protein [Gilvimarinus sp. SDUM040013]MDO3385281.1 DUF493 domain-containing protein [Gilvimarinus sp. SDUM040013]MDX6849264.1 DUF493 domain-containing protein [Gilvimarinus sp. SDUM040013]
MTPQDPPKIEFPCPGYPIKVLGDAGETLKALVIEVMQAHDPDFDTSTLKIKDSGKGRYQSITVYITATGIEQLETIHQDLRASSVVKVVL